MYTGVTLYPRSLAPGQVFLHQSTAQQVSKLFTYIILIHLWQVDDFNTNPSHVKLMPINSSYNVVYRQSEMEPVESGSSIL